MNRPVNRPADFDVAAQYSGCHRRTIERYVAEGKLTAYQVGLKTWLVDLDELDRLAEQNNPFGPKARIIRVPAGQYVKPIKAAVVKPTEAAQK